MCKIARMLRFSHDARYKEFFANGFPPFLPFQNLTKVPEIEFLIFLPPPPHTHSSQLVGLLGKQIFLFGEKLKILQTDGVGIVCK